MRTTYNSVTNIYSFDINSLYPEVLHMLSAKSKTLIPKKGYKGEWVIDLPWDKISEVLIWCKEHLGEPGHNRKYHWRATWTLVGNNHRLYEFTDEKPRIFLRREVDVTLFMLRWAV